MSEEGRNYAPGEGMRGGRPGGTGSSCSSVIRCTPVSQNCSGLRHGRDRLRPQRTSALTSPLLVWKLGFRDGEPPGQHQARAGCLVSSFLAQRSPLALPTLGRKNCLFSCEQPLWGSASGGEETASETNFCLKRGKQSRP